MTEAPLAVLALRHTVRAVELDARGRMGLKPLCDLLLEAASEHATALGAGSGVLSASGLTWVLVGWQLRVDRWPGRGEELEAETWPAGRTERAAERDFVLSAAGLGEVARATSTWLVIDVGRRRPVRLPPEVREIVPPERPRALEPGESRPRPPERAEAAVELVARRAEEDFNGHVRSTAYLDWLLESVPEPLVAAGLLRSLEVSFRAECGAGSRVRVESGPDGAPGDGPTRLRHRIASMDGRDLVLAASSWLTDRG